MNDDNKKLGIFFGLICFIIPIIGLILGIIKYKEAYGKTALTLGILGLICIILSQLFIRSQGI
ncbi:hypothetical protein J7620_01195 [Wohlfahrtiimonas chitiniclastica]|uniref:hypothetical protein n=1 Tax=Wohlfahrtiimonas chitiniclastica TaxID=400946 RepID=UPI001BCA7920|nr:hypothetical protein [Wohlfahrtiimonas chitiniclastica]MBS7833568.1 hypothetical protein [Wohlfahrtiimonas chitiniclastica]